MHHHLRCAGSARVALTRVALACAALLTPTVALAAPTAAAPGVTAEAGPDDPRLPYRAVAWGLLGTGAALAVASGLVYGMGMDDEAAITDAEAQLDGNGDRLITGITQVEAQRLQDSAGRLKTFGAVGLGVAGGLMLGALVTWILEPDAPAPCGPAAPAEPEIRPFSLAPSLGPAHAGLQLGFTF